MQYLRLFFLAGIILLSTGLYGQTELEIKTTGKYIYSWAIEDDSVLARNIAKLGFLDTIFKSILKEASIDQTDTIFIKEINYFENKIGFKWQAVAFADKSTVRVKLEERKKMKVIPVIYGDQPESVPDNVEHVSKPVAEESSPDPVNQHYDTGNAILDELLIIQDGNLLFEQLSRFKSELKLNFGSKSNYPDDSECYIFVIGIETMEVLAAYDKGKGERTDFLSDESISNYTEKYDGNIFVYVVII